MSDTPTFGRYAEIPYDQMTPEQQEGYRPMIESSRRASWAEQDLGAQPEAGESRGTVRRPFPRRPFLPYRARTRNRRLHHHQQISFRLSDQPRMSGAARKSGCRPKRSRR